MSSSLVSGAPTKFHGPGEEFREQAFPCYLRAAPGSLSSHHSVRASVNGQVDRYNRTLMDAVRCYVDKVQNCWSIAIGHEPELRLHVQQAYAGARGQYFYTKINLHVQNYVLEIKIHVHFKNTTI